MGSLCKLGVEDIASMDMDGERRGTYFRDLRDGSAAGAEERGMEVRDEREERGLEGRKGELGREGRHGR